MTAPIMLIQPPPQVPGCIGTGIDAVAARLEQIHHPFHFHDAAREFLEHAVLAPDTQLEWVDAAMARRWTRWHTDEKNLQDQARRNRHSASVFYATQPPEPEAAAAALRWIDDALLICSLAHEGLYLDRRSFSHGNLVDYNALVRFVHSDTGNPFRQYARMSGRSPIPSKSCGGLFFIIQNSSQLAPAASMAAVWQSQHPHLTARLCCVDADLQPTSDRLIPPTGPLRPMGDRIIAWLARMRGQPGADASARMLSAAPHQAVINGGPLSADAMQQVLNEMADTPNKVVVWTRPMPDQCPSPTAFKDITRLLYRAAESGCWNHVRLVGPAGNTVVDPMLDFASANPNIVHSWCRTTASASPFGDAQDHYPQQATRYGHTRPLPGLPLWRLLQDPPLLQVYLALNGVQRLASMYLIRQSKTWRCHPLGENLIYHFMPPDQLPKGYLDEICRMVAAGESVDTRWVRHNLQRAFLIGYAEENGVIAGNSSLKHPRETYIEAVSRQSGIDLRNYLERGYTSVRPAYRGLGIGTRLLEGLTRRSGSKKVFSIIAEDNIATRKMAIRNRTRRVATFYSHRAGKKVGVWIPERMVPAGVVLSGQPEVD